MKPRHAAAIIGGIAIALTASGCNMITPQATTISYDASDGISGKTGLVTFHNALLLVEQGGDTANLAVTFTNAGPRTTLVIQVRDTETQLTVESGLTTYGFQDDQIVVPLADAMPGSLVNVSFTADGADPIGVPVQVVSTETVGYETLGPTEAPATEAPATEAPAATPTPTP